MAKTLPVNSIIHGDCREVTTEWPDGCVDMCVTSPPFWGLRDYGVKGQLGLEKTPEEYIEKMVAVFAEVKRVLADYGTLWLNMGDSYNGYPGNVTQGGQLSGRNQHARQLKPHGYGLAATSLKPKDLCGIPWRLAFALQADGWYLRQDIIEEVELYCPCGCGHVLEERVWRYSQDQEIIWKKPNPMPESARDRCTKAHEYIFLLSKKPRYYYDQEAIREENSPAGKARIESSPGTGSGMSIGTEGQRFARLQSVGEVANGRNRRSVWTIPTQAMSEAHFATFPEKLVEPCILAGCPKEVCVECGKPRERVIEKSRVATRPAKNTKCAIPAGWSTGPGGHDTIAGRYRPSEEIGNRDPERHVSKSTTVGFTDCGCGKGFRPGIVFDPFGGSGTVGYVAARLKRDYVLIELSAEYIEKIAEPRLCEAETGVTVAEQRAGQGALPYG